MSTKAVYQVTRQGNFARDFGLAGQIQRAAVSVMSNIAERFERRGSSKFHQFLSIAKSSCAEVRSQLYVYVALGTGYLELPAFKQLCAQAEEVSRVLSGLKTSAHKQRGNL